MNVVSPASLSHQATSEMAGNPEWNYSANVVGATDNGTDEEYSNGDYDESFEQLIMFRDLQRMVEISRKVVPVVVIIIFVLGVLGNALVVYVTVITNRTAKHPIHSLFVLNLAAADVLFLIAGAPYQIAIHSEASWRYGPFLCPFIAFSATCSMAASIFTICALAWMRFMALVTPFRFQSSLFSTRKAGYVMIVVIWIAGIILASPHLAYHRLLIVANSTACDWNGNQTPYAMVKLVVTYILPLILMSVFYAVIGREVLCYMMQHNRSENLAAGGRNSAEDQRECAKSAMVVLSLILAFLICWLPHLLQTVFQCAGVDFGDSSHKSRFILDIVGQCMSYAHACVNPFIYTFASPLIRRSLRTSVRQKLDNCRRSNDLCGKVVFKRRNPATMPLQNRDTSAMGLDLAMQQTAVLLTADSPNGRTEHIRITTTADLLSSNPNTQPASPVQVKTPPGGSESVGHDEEVAQVLLGASQRIESSTDNDDVAVSTKQEAV